MPARGAVAPAARRCRGVAWRTAKITLDDSEFGDQAPRAPPPVVRVQRPTVHATTTHQMRHHLKQPAASLIAGGEVSRTASASETCAVLAALSRPKRVGSRKLRSEGSAIVWSIGWLWGRHWGAGPLKCWHSARSPQLPALRQLASLTPPCAHHDHLAASTLAQTLADLP